MTILTILAGVLILVIGCIIAAFVKGEATGKVKQAVTEQQGAISVAQSDVQNAQALAQEAVNMPSNQSVQELMKNDAASF